MAEMGRPRVLDEAKRLEIIALISTGYGLPGAAKYVGCAVSTIRREAQRDEAFGAQLRHAEKQARLRPLKAIRRKAHTHWRAAAWLLERTEPQRYAKKENRSPKPAELDGLFEAVLDQIIVELSLDPALEFIVERIAKSAKQKVLQNPAASTMKSDVDRMRNRGLHFFANRDPVPPRGDL